MTDLASATQSLLARIGVPSGASATGSLAVHSPVDDGSLASARRGRRRLRSCKKEVVTEQAVMRTISRG